MYRRVMGVGALALVAGLAVTGCDPVKAGAAAVVGKQRITIATLDTDASHLSSAAKSYPGVTFTQAEVTQATLSWLIRFQIIDEVAKQNGISVNNAQVANGQNEIKLGGQQQAQQQGQQNVSGITLDEVLVSAGIAPNLAPEAGAYQAIADAYLTNANGGVKPTASASNYNTLVNQLNQAQCQAAKTLNIQVSPQFGQLDYSNYAVVPGADLLSRPSGPKATPQSVQTAPAC